MSTLSSTSIPPVRLRADGESVTIVTLEEALAFAFRHPRPEGDYEGMIRRLEAARAPEDVVEAGHAFSWWAQCNDLLDETGKGAHP